MNRNNRRYRKNKNFNKSYYDKKLIKYLSLFIFVLLIILVIIAIFYTIHNSQEHKKFLETANQDQNYNLNSSSISEEKDDITFTMTAIGDIMCHNTQFMDAYDAQTDTYSFSYVFDEIKHYIENSDIAIGNLETSFAGKDRGYSNYPTFNSPDQLAYSLKQLGLDVITTAGNHCLDMGFSGLSRTIDILDNYEIAHLGTYKTAEARDSVFFQDVKGVKIAFLDYTYGTNGISIPSDKPFCVNLIDEDLILKDIENAKAQNADIIVSCMHWGTEYRTTANIEQETLADFLFKNGVDIILGNHPHVLEQMEKRTVTLDDGTEKECFVIYALGNFICDQNAENTRNSIILNLDITKHGNGKISIDKADYIPIYMYKNEALGLRNMKLLDIEKNIQDYESGVSTDIDESTYNFLKTQLDKITSIVGPEF